MKTISRTRSCEERADDYLTGFAVRLRDHLVGCRSDMHEPDEQGVTARVIGKKLDNAFGDFDNHQEMVVEITRDGAIERFNLATLIAAARQYRGM